MTYAVELQRTPSSGEPVFSQSTGSFIESDSPAREMVLLCLRTQKGACLVDPDLGVDWRALRKVTTNLPATAKDYLTAALSRYVRAGVIAGLAVATEYNAAVKGLVFTVTFTDPRLGRTLAIPGRF